jgi:RsiW-degrading membrane proteinase PrsW (M82 family)
MPTPTTLLWAFFGGIIPALLWLLFWLREDKMSPEPRGLITRTFIFGMLAVGVALFAENEVNTIAVSGSILSIILWAVIEEVSKFGAAYFGALRTKENNEPVDSMIYLITAALGFAALENAFFLIGPLNQGNLIESLATGNLRFIGSTLLHVITSGSIGIFAAYAFCELRLKRELFVGMGLILAVALHAFFNFFILKGDNNLLIIFGSVWVGVVLLILFFERVKRINRTCVTSS